MNLREKLGQLMLFGFPGLEPDADSLRLIQEYKAGNIILFSHNIESTEQMKALCAKLKAMILDSTGVPALIAIDQEGGVVSRFPEGAVSFPSAMAVAATGNPENARTAAHATARQLAALGVNFNLAPVLDINTNAANPVIGVRAYGCTAETVERFAMGAVRGHLEAGVMPAAKHFPGHGDTAVDSHLGLPCVEKTEAELMDCELLPYLRAIKEDIPAIMAAHILFPKLEPAGVPASMSPAILRGLLREKLGFHGLIVSDCFEMGAVQDNYGTPEGFVAALKAGLDLGCISHTPRLALEALCLAEEAVNNGSLPLSRVDEAVEHVLACKKRFAGVEAPWEEVGKQEYREAAQAMRNVAVTRLDSNGLLPPIDEKTLFVGCPAYRATFASSAPDDGGTFAETLAGRFGARFLVTGVNPSEKEIARAVSLAGAGTVVAGTYNGHLNQNQLRLVNALCDAGCKVVAVALRNPYDLPLLRESTWKLAAYEYTAYSFLAVERVLRGAEAAGKLELPKGGFPV